MCTGNQVAGGGMAGQEVALVLLDHLLVVVVGGRHHKLWRQIPQQGNAFCSQVPAFKGAAHGCAVLDAFTT